MGIESLGVNLLNGYVGKNIVDICEFGFTGAGENHCAHFVSHVLQLEFGYTCGPGGKGGRNIRVQEVFANCPEVGAFDKRPSESCLVFVTAPGNVHLGSKIIDNVPKKHIGIYYNGTIWHYSNSHQRVVTQTPGEFIHHYPHQTNALFYGTFPADATAVPFVAMAAAEAVTA